MIMTALRVAVIGLLSAQVFTSSGCRQRASAQDYSEAQSDKSERLISCKVSDHKPNGSQVRGLVGRSLAGAVNSLNIKIPSKDSNDLSTITFGSENKDVADLKVDRMGFDLYDRWTRPMRFSGGATRVGSDQVLLKVVIWYDKPVQMMGFVEFEEGSVDDPVKVRAKVECR